MLVLVALSGCHVHLPVIDGNRPPFCHTESRCPLNKYQPDKFVSSSTVRKMQVVEAELNQRTDLVISLFNKLKTNE